MHTVTVFRFVLILCLWLKMDETTHLNHYMWISYYDCQGAFQLFVQQLIHADNKENIKTSYNCPFVVGIFWWSVDSPLQWRHNERNGISNHQSPNCLLNCLFRSRSKKTSKLRVTGLCEGNSPVTGEFPAQRASNAENVSIWWRHHAL